MSVDLYAVIKGERPNPQLRFNYLSRILSCKYFLSLHVFRVIFSPLFQICYSHSSWLGDQVYLSLS